MQAANLVYARVRTCNCSWSQQNRLSSRRMHFLDDRKHKVRMNRLSRSRRPQIFLFSSARVKGDLSRECTYIREIYLYRTRKDVVRASRFRLFNGLLLLIDVQKRIRRTMYIRNIGIGTIFSSFRLDQTTFFFFFFFLRS